MVDNVVDVSKSVRHVILSLLVLQNDVIPTIVERVDHQKQDAEPLNLVDDLVHNPTDGP